jgi:hypothetical protein
MELDHGAVVGAVLRPDRVMATRPGIVVDEIGDVTTDAERSAARLDGVEVAIEFAGPGSVAGFEEPAAQFLYEEADETVEAPTEELRAEPRGPARLRPSRLADARCADQPPARAELGDDELSGPQLSCEAPSGAAFVSARRQRVHGEGGCD